MQKQITDIVDLQRVAPSLSVGTGQTGPATAVFLSLRGQTQPAPNSFTDSPIGIYVDGVYVARSISANVNFLDVASVEVLRGPQGTLFGRNTTGGALNVTSAQPTSTFEGYVKAGYGNYDAKLIEGVLNVPLGEDLAARFAGRYTDHDGYYPSPFLGYRPGKVEGSYYGRASVKWTPTALPLTWLLIGDYADYRDTGAANASSAINPNGPVATFYGISQGVRSGAIPGSTPITLGPGFTLPASAFTDFSYGPVGVPISAYVGRDFVPRSQRGALYSNVPRTTYIDIRSGNPEIDRLFAFNKAGSITSDLTFELDAITIKSITGYRKSHTSNSNDLAALPIAVAAYVQDYRQEQISQELQISGEVGNLSYITGFYFFRESGSERADTAILYNTPLANFNRTLADYSNRSLGVFTQANYQFNDRLRVTGGIRYSWDHKTINRHGLQDYRVADPICNNDPGTGLPLSQAPCDAPDSANFSFPAWIASIDYKISDELFAYVKTSGASNSGGFNNRDLPPLASRSFEPESVRDVELGLKGEFLDRRLRTNLAGYYSWQHNAQRPVNAVFANAAGQNTTTQYISNAGNARIYGLEAEAELIPWRGMTINASGSYLNASYVRGSRIEEQLVNGNIVQVDRSGEPVIQAPKWTLNAGATQEIRFDAGTLTLHADYAYISDRYWDYITSGDPALAASDIASNQATLVRGYSLVNATIGFALREPAVEIIGYVRNLTNKVYFTGAYGSYTGLGVAQQSYGAPRTYGITVAYRF